MTILDCHYYVFGSLREVNFEAYFRNANLNYEKAHIVKRSHRQNKSNFLTVTGCLKMEAVCLIGGTSDVSVLIAFAAS